MMKKTTAFFTAILLLLAASCSQSGKHITHEKRLVSNQGINQEMIVLAHGLGRSDTAMWRLEQRLTSTGYQVCSLDYASIGESVKAVLDSTNQQIEQCLSHPAPKVHFVGHSLGGLVIRSYLQAHQQLLTTPKFGGVVLIGTPNKGSEVADHYAGSLLMELGGGISESLVTGKAGISQRLKEIDINAGVIAGTKSSSFTKSLFAGPNDGLVSVASTKLTHMKDFIAINVGHSSMRYNSDVANQTIHYLRHGQFVH